MTTKPDLRGKRQLADKAFGGLAIGAAALVVLILALIAITMTNRARPVLGHMGLDFFTSSTWSEHDNVVGALPFIWGTVYTAVIAVVLAVPVSLGLALFITQIAPPWLKRPLVYLIDLLAVVPSVVFGLWGVLMLAPHLNRSFLTAGIILAIMIVPIITSLARGDPVVDDLRGRDPAREGRPRRRRDARARPRDGRDDRRGARDRQLGAD